MTIIAEILEEAEGKPPVERELTKAEQIALQGLPKLGEAVSCVIHIRESKEFKVRRHIKTTFISSKKFPINIVTLEGKDTVFP